MSITTFIRLTAQYIDTFRRGKVESAARQTRFGVDIAEGDGGFVAEAVFQLHIAEGIAFKADADVLVARIVLFRGGHHIIHAAGGAVFFQAVAGVQCGFVRQNRSRAVADGLVLVGFGDLF